MSTWSGVGEAYSASYAALCAGTTDAILAALGDARSRSVLDVGSGTGSLVAALADAGWIASGSEPEASMREIAAARHPRLGFVSGALPDLPFEEASFDAVTANFVLNHVPDPRAAAAEMARIGGPDAVLVATIWTVSPSWFWSSVRDRAGLPPATGEPLPAHADFERTAEGFERMLDDGNWHDLDVSELSWTWQVPREALWTSAEGGVASAGAFYRGLDEPRRARFRAAFEGLCDEHEQDGSIALEHTAAIARGITG